MNTSNILILILAAALVVLSVRLVTLNSKVKGASDTSSAVIDNIMTRSSVRSYQDRAIEEEKIETMLRAAMAAPSAGDKRPQRFVVVRDKEILGRISENLHTMTMAKSAPLAIIVCGDMNKTFPGDGLDYWVEDASASTENLLLAAHGLGLGAVWCGVYPMMQRVAFIQELLGLPQDIVPLNVVVIGYPAEVPAPKEKWNPDYVRYDTWAGRSAGVVEQEAAGKTWRKIDPKELRESPFRLFSDGAALSVGNKDKMNSMTIGWGGLGNLWGMDRDVVTVYVEKRRYTHSFMEENDYFTVTAFTKEYDDALQYLGTVSGRDEDKFKGSGLTVKWTESGTPAFEEGRLILECKKIYGAPFDPEGFGELAKQVYSIRPLHSVYIGEIVNAWVKE